MRNLTKKSVRVTPQQAARGFPKRLKAWSWYDLEAVQHEKSESDRLNRSQVLFSQAAWHRIPYDNPQRVRGLLEEAWALNPEDLFLAVFYANFLATAVDEIDQADLMWQQALTLSDGTPQEKPFLIMYSQFLDQHVGDHVKAREVRDRLRERVALSTEEPARVRRKK